jgi:pyruvate/2-oxoglutarate dehydrogenase complex dihydrolipoamide dehydrogenase (E3) component
VGAGRYRRLEVRATSHLHRLIFTDPEVAAVGLTATQAELAGYLTPARMVVDEDRQVIIGMTFVGRDVAELLYAATIAVAGEIPLKRLRNTVPRVRNHERDTRLLEGYGRLDVTTSS